MKNKITPVLISLAVITAVAGAVFLRDSDGDGDGMVPQLSLSQATTTDTGISYTLAEISAHKDASSCWSSINGGVYDLTSWISKHPGGEGAILGICGKDGSTAFNMQHGGQKKQAEILATFKIGILSK